MHRLAVRLIKSLVGGIEKANTTLRNATVVGGTMIPDPNHGQSMEMMGCGGQKSGANLTQFSLDPCYHHARVGTRIKKSWHPQLCLPFFPVLTSFHNSSKNRQHGYRRQWEAELAVGARGAAQGRACLRCRRKVRLRQSGRLERWGYRA